MSHAENFHAEDEKVDNDTPVKFLTLRSLLMGVLSSVGGFIFGYDTGMRLPSKPIATKKIPLTIPKVKSRDSSIWKIFSDASRGTPRRSLMSAQGLLLGL